MGKAIRNYLLLLGLVVLVMMLTLFSSKGNGVDWSKNYQADSKQPYGLSPIPLTNTSGAMAKRDRTTIFLP